MDNQNLQHFGVPGMKWGVRKQPDQFAPGSGRKMGKMEKKIITKLSKTKSAQALTKHQITAAKQKEKRAKDIIRGEKAADDFISKNGRVKLSDITSASLSERIAALRRM